MRDHLSWETTKSSVHFIQVSLYKWMFHCDSFIWTLQLGGFLEFSNPSQNTLKWHIQQTCRMAGLDINTLRPWQNGRHFPDDIFKHIFLNENVWISLKISLKFVPKGPINSILALVQIMSWRRPGDKPLSEPMMINLLAHICVTGPQWVKVCQHARGMQIWSQGKKFSGYVPLWASDFSVCVCTYFLNSIQKLCRICTDIGWARRNFCRAHKFLEPCARWAYKLNA